MCEFPARFCPHPPPTKKKSSSNAWCAKIWASSRACHTIHEEEVVKSEHSPGQHNLYSKQECQQTLSRDSRFSFLQKKHVIFLHSIISTFTFKIPLNWGFIAKSECLWKFHFSSIRIYPSARSNLDGKGHLARSLSSLPWLLEGVSESIGGPHVDQEPITNMFY